MNIIHITTYLQGGAGRIVKDLAIKQCENGNNVIVVINNKEEIGYENYNEYIRALEENKIKVYRVESTFKRDVYLNIQAASELNKIISNNDIDLIHAHAAVPSVIAMISKSNSNKSIPIIQTMHGWGTNKNINHEKMDVSILNMVNKVVTVSNADKKLLVDKGVNIYNIKTIYNGIEKVYDKIDEDKILTEVLTGYKKDNKLIIGCIGSVCERKNQKIIIESLRYVKSKNIKIVLLGEGDLINDLKELAQKYEVLDRVLFYGYVNKAFLYLKYFDYVLLPSLSEGLPLTALEAYRDGVPIAVSDIDCMKEIVEDNKSGFIFDRNNPKELAYSIDKLISLKNTDKYMQISENGKNMFLKKFHIEAMYESYIKLYKSILEDK